MIYLNIGLIFELFVKNKKENNNVLIFTVAIITTLSTAGYIICLLIFLSYLLKKKNIALFIKSSVFLILISLFVSENFEVFEITLNKFDSESNEYGSFLARYASITVPFSIFLDSPFLGEGLASFAKKFEVYSLYLTGIPLKADSQSTNTFFNSLATYGLIFFCILVVGIFRLSHLFSENNLVRWLLFISLLLMLSNEDLRYSLLFSSLLFYGILHPEINSKTNFHSRTD